MDAQHELMQKIQILGFVVHDTVLFLDTHPMDQDALSYYHHYNDMLKEAVAQYNATYGPMNSSSVMSKNNWTWIEKPWPWEMEA
jgi:hypothetical protein